VAARDQGWLVREESMDHLAMLTRPTEVAAMIHEVVNALAMLV